ncbi:hypothetical protein EDB83DRAFT_2670633 [Lactarius deliciosus]|nr:hypothetical protein EDB83DRAFT_2670633 [Lactarius deliciosus]
MPRCVSSLLTTPVLGSPVALQLDVSGCQLFYIVCLLMMSVLGFPPIILTAGLLFVSTPRTATKAKITFLFLYQIVQVMSLPTIQNLTSSGLSGHHLILTVILIFKHATFLRLSNVTSKSALLRAELDYRDANIDSSIQKYLMASSQEHSVELFAAFIMATDIVPSESSVKNRV